MSNYITITSTADNTFVCLDKKSAFCSGLLQTLLEEFESENNFDIPNIRGDVLRDIANFLNYQRDAEPQQLPKPLPGGSLNKFLTDYENAFLERFDEDIYGLFDRINAANYLGIPRLLEICSAKAAIMIKHFNQKQFMEAFQIESDMTSGQLDSMEAEFKRKKANRNVPLIQ